MLGSIGSIILLIIIVGCIVYWFVLKKQIDEEDGDRIEPSIDSSFSEFSQKELPKERSDDDFDDYEDEVVAPQSVKSEEKIAVAAQKEEIRKEEQKNETYDLFDEDKMLPVEEAPKKNFFARLKESFMGEKDVTRSSNDQDLARPAPIRTVALILKAPEDQPYIGQEVLEIGED
ncbi:MAG: cell division protein ZipA C-terminal FtsZ-binding domain-containing protein, partial [Wohlfahrtiimonas sp.]